MEKPDVELELKRDEDGNITNMAYKVSNEGEGGKRALEFTEMALEALRAEGPEDHSTMVDVNFTIPL